ncbi:MAG: hypothetical protein GX284_02495 [Clostridiales bacterium]|nr:hypothetical protein [Clostridiales bacterium]
MSGCPEGGSETTFFQILGKKKDGKGERVLTNTEAQTIELTEKTELYVVLRVYKGATVDNITFKPMLENGPTAHEYKPYLLSNAGLQKQITEQKNKLEEDTVPRTTLADKSNVLTVGKKGARFTTINDAITEAKKYCSKENRILIFVYPGTYNEQITMLDNPGIDFMGSGASNTILTYDGEYPNCVIYTTGEGKIEGFNVNNTNANAYAIHYETGNTSVTGTTVFKDCVVSASQPAIGIGSGANCTIELENCVLKSNNAHALYMHNNPYSNKENQKIAVRNCILNSTGSYDVLVDDACNSAGNTNSKLLILFANNGSTKHKMVFRKNTGDTSTNKRYIPNDDSNISLDTHSVGNDIYGLTYGKNQVTGGAYVMKTANSTPGTSYWNYSCPFPDANRYNWTVNNVTIPGVGDITSGVSVENVGTSFVLLKDTSSGGAGYNVSVSIIGTPK